MKKAAIITLIVCAAIVSNLVLAYLAFNLIIDIINYEPLYHYLPADKVDQFLLYDHIEYNGEDYYLAESDFMADNIIPDFSEEVEVVIADSNCKAYGDGKTYIGYFCQNDDDHSYMYYGSAYYVNDLELAYSYSDDDMEDWIYE